MSLHLHTLDRQNDTLGSRFSLLCWNVHKEMGTPAFDRTFCALRRRYDPDLWLLQEAPFTPYAPHCLETYDYALAFNLKRHGVLSAARCRFETAEAVRTRRRELRIATRKSFLITRHRLQNGAMLTAVNLHAINFVSAAVFADEILRLYERLRTVEGPLIVAGDFNTWSTKRLRSLDEFAAHLSLKQAAVHDAHHIKRMLFKPLDHLFYRGLTLLDARAVDTQQVSDHNPLIASFET